jgi:hypothetical protein
VGRLRDAERLADSYGLLLGVILLQILMLPLLDDTRWGVVLQAALMGVMLLLALHISKAHRTAMRVAWVVVVTALVLVTVDALAENTATNGLPSLLLGLLLLACPVAILRRIFAHPRINGQTVLGAICVYLLLGLTFTFLFHGVWAIDQDAFSGNLGPSAQAGLGYFSYVTLATLGYGDIVPVNQLARSLAVIEALMGQIFLVTLVAALVGNLGRERRRPPDPDPAPDPT